MYWIKIKLILDFAKTGLQWSKKESVTSNIGRTFKPVYNDHTWDQKIVSVVKRYSLFTYSKTFKRTQNVGRYGQVVVIGVNLTYQVPPSCEAFSSKTKGTPISFNCLAAFSPDMPAPMMITLYLSPPVSTSMS